MRVRAYVSADRDVCLAIFDGNTPRFFGAGERPSFAAFLERPVGTFLVLCEEDGAVVGCGGVAVRNDRRTAYMVWGMIRPDRELMGHGRSLALARLKAVAAMPEVDKLALDTSQEAVGFYEKLGFKLVRHTPDHYAPGLHRHDMELWVDESFRGRMRAEPE